MLSVLHFQMHEDVHQYMSYNFLPTGSRRMGGLKFSTAKDKRPSGWGFFYYHKKQHLLLVS